MTDFESQTENAAEPRPEPDFLPNAFAGPAWNISSEYPSLASNEFVHDLAQLDHLIQTMTAHAAAMKPAIANADRGSSYNSNQDRLITDLQAFSELETQAHTLLGNLTTFVKCEVDLDGTDGEAIRMAALLAEKRASLMTAVAGPRLFLDRATEEFIQRFLLHEHTADEEFALRQSRTLKDTRLTENEQTLLEQLRPHGFEAWSNLYNQIASSLRCRIENPDGSTKTVGLAHAAASFAVPRKRKDGWPGTRSRTRGGPTKFLARRLSTAWRAGVSRPLAGARTRAP